MSVIKLTSSAARRVVEMSEKSPGKVVRFSAKSGGCSGYKYVFDFADAAGPADIKVEHDNAVVFVDPQSLMHVLGTEVDWQESVLERKFVFTNPMEMGRCGCGESFTVS